MLRLWVLGRQPVSSDEAVVGLMAREILRGHFFAFYWGQSYGGGEPYVVAAVFALFGQSIFTLGLTPVLLDAAAALLLWRTGRRLFNSAVGAAAAALFWVWPEVYVWQSTMEYGFRLLALDCGLVCVLVALRLIDGEAQSPRARLALWALFGGSVGLGWWCTPEIAYYAVPSGVLVAWRVARRRARITFSEATVAASAAVIGALPWLWANLPRGFPSLRRTGGPDASFGLHIRLFARYVLPMVLGFRLRASAEWLVAARSGGSDVHDLVEALCVVAVVVGLGWLVWLAARRRAPVLVGFVVLFPFLYAYWPQTWYWQDGRYAVYLAPMAALVAVSACDAAARFAGRTRPGPGPTVRDGSIAATLWRGLPLVVLVSAGLALTITAIVQLSPYRPEVSPGRTGWFTWRSDPDEAVVTVAHGLEAAGIRYAYAGYWLAYVLDFEARGRVVASDLIEVRYKPYLREIERSRDPSWLFENPAFSGQAGESFGTNVLDPGCDAGNERCLLASDLESWLGLHRDPYSVADVGDFLLVAPRQPIDPSRVFAAFGITR